MLSGATYGVGGKLVENIVLISHGGMAEGVKSSLEMIVGQQANVHTVSLRPDSDNLQFEKELNEKMKALNGSNIDYCGSIRRNPVQRCSQELFRG